MARTEGLLTPLALIPQPLPSVTHDLPSAALPLYAEELSLRDLRKARQLTQERLAEMLHMRQENVSRLEQRSDLLLSTLSSYY
ncbi:MAG: helix-turn-helix transcriptional regulator [Caldilineaceae bacterium]